MARASQHTPLSIRTRKGLDIALAGAPVGEPRPGRPLTTVALLGNDCPGVRPEFRVGAGDRVRTGETLFVDRRRPAIAFTSPATGRVMAINLGARRMLDSVVVEVGDDDFVDFDLPPGRPDRATLRALLLRAGLWPALRTRPFGRIPDPEAVPAALFVTAIDTNPLAADPLPLILRDPVGFRQGVAALALLTDGPVFVCQRPGPPVAEGNGIRVATFEGPHPAGLPGTHIHLLMPASATRSVWHVGWRDVAAIGALLATGRLDPTRLVALCGPGAAAPGLVETRFGASLDDLARGETGAGPVRLISGSVLSGRASGYLGRHHAQVTILPEKPPSPRGILARLASLLPGAPAGPTLPMEAFERAMPLDILPAPLMRALAVGDVETAERLGCLELVEEDMALLSHLCPGRADHGALLRRVLDEIAETRP